MPTERPWGFRALRCRHASPPLDLLLSAHPRGPIPAYQLLLSSVCLLVPSEVLRDRGSPRKIPSLSLSEVQPTAPNVPASHLHLSHVSLRVLPLILSIPQHQHFLGDFQGKRRIPFHTAVVDYLALRASWLTHLDSMIRTFSDFLCVVVISHVYLFCILI